MSQEIYRREYVQRPEDTPIKENEIRVTGQGKVRRYISYAASLFQERKVQEITMKAMGKAINKTVTIAEIIKRRVPGLHQTTEIGSTDLKEIYHPKEEGLDPVEIVRHVSSIIITLSLVPLDTTHGGYQPPLPFEEVRPMITFNTVNRGRGTGRGGRGFGGRGRGFVGGRGFSRGVNRGFSGRGTFPNQGFPTRGFVGRGYLARGMPSPRGIPSPGGIPTRGNFRGISSRGISPNQGFTRGFSDRGFDGRGRGTGRGRARGDYSLNSGTTHPAYTSFYQQVPSTSSPVPPPLPSNPVPFPQLGPSSPGGRGRGRGRGGRGRAYTNYTNYTDYTINNTPTNNFNPTVGLSAPTYTDDYSNNFPTFDSTNPPPSQPNGSYTNDYGTPTYSTIPQQPMQDLPNARQQYGRVGEEQEVTIGLAPPQQQSQEPFPMLGRGRGRGGRGGGFSRGGFEPGYRGRGARGGRGGFSAPKFPSE